MIVRPRACLWPVLAAALSCATHPAPATQLPAGPGPAHYTWVQTQCVDGGLPLAETGFEQTLSATRVGNGLLLVLDTSMIDRGCTELSALSALPDPEQPEGWNLQPEASVTLPLGAPCGPKHVAATRGRIVIAGEELQLTMQRSPWCRGFDATIHYRRIVQPATTAREVVRQYLLHFARGDAASAAQLFSEVGSLVEPFSRDPDGNTTRHRGRAEVADWLAAALEGPRWTALRVRSLSASGPGGQFIAEWEYMDDGLVEPVFGRNLFVVADGEIFETELQLLSIPTPLAAAQSLDAGVLDAAAGDGSRQPPGSPD